MIDTIQNIIQPLLTEYIGLLILGVITWAMSKLPTRLRLDIEQRHRDALHRAIDTGIGLVFDSLQKHPGVAVPDMAVTQIIKYVRASVPDALERLAPSQAQLEAMARAKLARAIDTAIGRDRLAEALQQAKPDDGWRAPHVPVQP